MVGIDIDPETELFDRIDRRARALLHTMEPAPREKTKKDLFTSCKLVPKVALEFWWMVAISPDERQALKYITC